MTISILRPRGSHTFVCDAAVSLRQPVTARSFKTREGGITETNIDGSDEVTQKAQEIASNLKVRPLPTICPGESAVRMSWVPLQCSRYQGSELEARMPK